MWVSKKRMEDIEKRLTNIEAQINKWQSHSQKESEQILQDVIARFQSPNGAIRGNAPKSS